MSGTKLDEIATAKLARLGALVFGEWPEYIGDDVDGADLHKMMVEAGVIIEVAGGFDPEKHTDIHCSTEPGDPWFQIAPGIRAALARALPSSQSEGDQ